MEFNRSWWFGLFGVLLGIVMTSPNLHADEDLRDSSSPFGVLDFVAWNDVWNGHHYTPEKVDQAADLMRDAGVGWVRMDFTWADIEPKEGEFNFERFDGIVASLQARGLRILGILEYNPAWRPGDWNAAPDPDAYVRYARAVVGHFKDRVRYWEIWNEPDQDTYWTPQDDLTSYAELLKKVYPELKAEDPDCKILCGSMSQSIPFHLRTLYKKAGAGSFDIVNFHPFVNPLDANASEQLHGVYISVKRVMDEFGDSDKPIWITEIGSPGVTEATSDNTWWLGKSPTESEQARWVRTVYRETLSWPGVQRVFWAFFRDTDHHFNNGIDFFGLIRNDFSVKPSYGAYRDAVAAAAAPDVPTPAGGQPPVDDHDATDPVK